MHDSYPIVGVLHADEQAYYTLAKRHHNTSDIFVCVSDRVNRTTKSQVPEIDASRFFTIPCGINLPGITYSQHSGNILNMVYVGRIADYQKRTSDLLKVVQEMAKHGSPFHLTIIGDGTTARPALEKAFKDAQMDQYVTFTGWLSQQEVHKYLTESDVLVLTSDFEGMPIAMMEGLAAGCGFVGTRVSGIEDYADHPLAPECFSVFDVGDVADAARKILKMGAVPIIARQTAARKLAESQFSMKTCLDNYLEAIETIPARSYSPTPIAISSSAILKSKMISMARAMKMSMKG
jgi:glycosyltransferase involved in cell wall biosynthesis